MSNVQQYPEGNSQQAFSSGLTLVDFWAPWCGPCRMMHPVLDELTERCEHLNIVKVNVDENSTLASEFGVSAIPLLVLMREGEIIERFVGVQPLNALISAVDQASAQNL